MNKIILFTLMVLLSTNVYALGFGSGGGTNTNTNNNTSTTTNNNGNDNYNINVNRGGDSQARSRSNSKSKSWSRSNSNSNSRSNSRSFSEGGKSKSISKSGDSSAISGDSSAVSGDSVSESNNKVKIEGDTIQGDTYIQRKIPVSTAYAPALTSGIDTCTGSFSAGGQATTFGLSFGKTIIDKDCVLRKDVRLLHNMGYPRLALVLFCQKESVQKATASAGYDHVCGEVNQKLPTEDKCKYPNQFGCQRRN